MIDKFWHGKRVLITGDKGFVGSHLSNRLFELGACVFGMDIKARAREDVCDYYFIENIIRAYQIQIIYHLAAEAIVGNVHKIPRKAMVTNICGTWNILEATRVVGNIEAVIVASSDKAYGEHKKLPYKEDYPLLAKYPYDVSKKCADNLAQAYYNSYQIPVVITRCGNIYGPGDNNACRLVPSAITCYLKKDVLKIRGKGKFIRDFIYIDDVVDAYVRIAECFKSKNLAGEIFNIGAESPISVVNFVMKMNKILGNKLKYKLVGNAFGEINRQYLDASKARKVLEWQPKWTLDKGLAYTIKGAVEHGAY